MTTLIAVDGHSLNAGLQRAARDRNKGIQNGPHSRFRIDHQALGEFLADPSGWNEDSHKESPEVDLRFYTDSMKVETDQVMGRVTNYFGNKGYGFISATDGNSYFFHNNEITNKRSLCLAREDRYPHPTSREFQTRIVGAVVTFEPITNSDDNRTRAEEVRIEAGARALDQYYRLRREPFLEMLVDSGYAIVRTMPSQVSGKSKSIDVRICLDASWELEGDDNFILLSDDPIFTELAFRLLTANINVTLVTFKTSRSEELRNSIIDNKGKVIFLEDHLDDLELAFEDDYDDETDDEVDDEAEDEADKSTEDESAEENALASA